MANKKIFMLMLLIFFYLSACEEKVGDARFSTPSKTYDLWLKAAVKGDYVAGIECVTKASVKFMDSMVRSRKEFMERMVGAAKIYNNFDIVTENIKGANAVVVISEPKSGNSIAIPFQYEEGAWKVDLITMFSGFVKG